MDRSATDKTEAIEIQKRSEALEKIEQDDLKFLLKNPHGFRFIQRIMDMSKIMNNCFTGNSSTYFNEGRKAVALDIFVDIQAVAAEVSPTIIQDLFLNQDYRTIKQPEEKNDE